MALMEVPRELRFWLRKPVQNPPAGPFNSDRLNWILEEAIIPADRLDDFLEGEGNRKEVACTYTKRKTDDVDMVSGKCTIYYWCCYGPGDERTPTFKAIPDASGRKGKGRGSRPLAAYRSLGISQQRGCRSHFHVYLFEARKEIVLIKWTSRAHLDKTGKPCHGLHDSSALAGKAVVAPRLSKRCRDYVERMLRTGVEPREILNFHVKEMRRNYGEVTDEKTIWHRDLQLTTKDVDNIRARLRKLMHNYHPDDAIATKMWVEQNSEKVIYYQGGNQENGVPFMLVVATDWMLKNLASLGHGNALVRAMWESIGSDSVIAAHAAVMLTDVSEKVKMLLARRSSLDDVTIEPFTSLPGTDNSLKRKPDFLERHFQRTEGRKRQTEVSSQALTQLEVSVPQFIRKVQPRESMQQQLDGRALLSMDLNAIPIEYTTDVLPAKRRK